MLAAWNVASLTCLVMGTASAVDGSWTFALTAPLADGPHAVTAIARDVPGRVSTVSAPAAFTVDTTAPVSSFSATPENDADIHATFEFGSSESGSSFECSLDGAAFAPCESPASYRELSPGTHTFEVRATDAAGNQGEVARHEWRSADLQLQGGGCASTGSGNGTALLGGLLALLGMALKSRKRAVAVRSASRAAVLVAVVVAGGVRAQTAVPSFQLEALRMEAGGRDSLVVGGRPIEKGAYRAAVTQHFEHDPLVLYMGGARVGSVVSDRLTTLLSGAYAFTDWFELGVQLPIVLFQRGDDLSGQGYSQPRSFGLSTPWVDGRFGILRQGERWPVDVSARLGIGLPLGTASVLGRDPGLAVDLSADAGRDLGGWVRVSGELGLSLRPAVVLGRAETVADEVGSALRLGGAVTTLGTKLRGELSLRAAVPFTRSPAALELLLGGRYRLPKNFEVFAMAGPGLGRAPGTPSYRLLAGIALLPGGF